MEIILLVLKSVEYKSEPAGSDFIGGRMLLRTTNSNGTERTAIIIDPDQLVKIINNDLYVENNIGIGTTAPTSKLDVNGTVNVTGIATFSDNVSIANTENKTYPPTGSSWNVSVGLDQYLEVGGTQVVNSNGIKAGLLELEID